MVMKNVIPIYDGAYLLDEVCCLRVSDISDIKFDYHIRASKDKDNFYTIEVSLKDGTKVTEYIEGANIARYNTYNTESILEIALQRLKEVLNEYDNKI